MPNTCKMVFSSRNEWNLALFLTMEVMNMNNLKMAAIAAGILAVAGSAVAQSTFDPTPYNFSFRIGGALPQDSAVRGDKDFWNAIGVDYNFATSALKNGNGFVSIDVISTDFLGEGDSIFSLMLANRFASNSEEGPYFVAGLGALFTDFVENKTTFGAMLGGGVRLSQAVFIEGRYTYGRKVDGFDPSSIGIYVGYRF